MDFNFWGIKTTIDESIMLEIGIYRQFVNAAQKGKKEYFDFYKNCTGTNEIVAGSTKIALKIYTQMASLIVGLLTENGIYGISENDILNMHDTYRFEDVLENIKDNIQDIENQRKQEQKYREMRKQRRGKFVGGGFGVGGAVKGMAMAGAANMATGFAHSVFNIFGNIGSDLKRNSSINKIYNSGTYKKLADAIYLDCMDFYDISENIFSAKGFQSGDIERRIKNSKAIYNQIINNQISQEHLPQAISEMISLFPADESYYTLACNLLDGSNGELLRCMKTCSLDTSEFEVAEVCQEIRNYIFGESLKGIIENKKYYYLDKFFYNEKTNGIIPYILETSNMFYEWLNETLQDLKETVKTNFEIYLDGQNWNTIAVIKKCGYNLGKDEVPIFGIKLYESMSSSSTSIGYLILTSESIILLSRSEVKAFPIMEVIEISENIGDHYNYFKINDTCIEYSSLKDSVDSAFFADFLWDAVALFQSIHLIETEIKIPLLTGKKVNKKHEIGSLLIPDYKSLLVEEDNFSEFINEIYTQKENTVNSKSEVFEGKECIAKLTDYFGKHIELTKNKLYIQKGKKKNPEKIEFDLKDVQTFYYEWKFADEAFYINNIRIDAMNFHKDSAKEFCGLFWYLKSLILDDLSQTNNETTVSHIQNSEEMQIEKSEENKADANGNNVLDLDNPSIAEDNVTPLCVEEKETKVEKQLDAATNVVECKNCKTQAPPEAKFCPKCGKRLNKKNKKLFWIIGCGLVGLCSFGVIGCIIGIFIGNLIGKRK